MKTIKSTWKEKIFYAFGNMGSYFLWSFFIKLFGKRIVLIGATACVTLGNIIGSCFPFSWVAGLIAVLVKGFGSAVVMSQLFSLAPDLVAYIEAKIGLRVVRVEGLAASANSFGQKIGSGLGTAASLWAIALCGYKAKAATQTDQVIYTFITFYWWIPTVLSLVLVLLASFWNIESKTKALVAAKGLSVPLSQQKEQGSIK
jgi:GPH family glycoside/pentoside/hexuronide:cation symporter